MISKKNILCAIAVALLMFGCSSSGDSHKKNTVTPASANFIMPKSEDDAFLFYSLGETLMSVDHGVEGKTVVIQTGSGYTEVLFDRTGTLKETFNPLSGHQIMAGLISNRLYLLLYNQQKLFIHGITVFEKNNSIWVADVHMSPDLSRQIMDLLSTEIPAEFSIITSLESGLSNIRKADPKAMAFSELLAKPAQNDRVNEVGGSAGVSLIAQYAAIGVVEVGLSPLVRKNSTSEITREVTREFAGAALATLGLMQLSDEKKSADLLKCLGDVDICKKSSDDPMVNSSMELFSGLLSKDSNQDVLKNILSTSRLRWDMLAGSTHRFFDPKTDGKPPSFKPIKE